MLVKLRSHKKLSNGWLIGKVILQSLGATAIVLPITAAYYINHPENRWINGYNSADLNYLSLKTGNSIA